MKKRKIGRTAGKAVGGKGRSIPREGEKEYRRRKEA